MSERRKPGCCILCDAPCFEVKQVFGPHHPLRGEPLLFGGALDHAWRVSILRSDGAQSDVTTCAEHADAVDGNLTLIRTRALLAMKYEWDTRALRGDANPITPAQEAAHMAYRRRESKVAFLGVTGKRKWCDVIAKTINEVKPHV